jgi:RimJ/RimL family protein N-acetyltransferase
MQFYARGALCLPTLRAIRWQDCEVLWHWVNDPGVRAASFHSEEIPFEVHTAWFEKKLHDSQCWMYLVKDPIKDIGQVRFDCLLSPKGWGIEAEIDVSIATELRGLGLGTHAIDLACKQFHHDVPGCEVIRATIKTDNIASLRAFSRAGFWHVAYQEDRHAVVLHKTWRAHE